MTRLCFIDTETTSLRPDRRAWEIGLIVREPGQPDTPHRWFIDSGDLDLGNADLMALKVGRFHERHPDINADAAPGCQAESLVLRQVEALTRDAHLVGAVVNFDAEVLGQRMRAHGICPSWHYHLIDVEALAVGCLAVRGWPARFPWDGPGPVNPGVPPWKSDDLSAALGVTISEVERHTALGDAKWAMRIYDAVMGGAS